MSLHDLLGPLLHPAFSLGSTQRMSERLAEELERRRLPYVTVTGPHDSRLSAAADAIDAVLGKGWDFTDPR